MPDPLVLFYGLMGAGFVVIGAAVFAGRVALLRIIRQELSRSPGIPFRGPALKNANPRVLGIAGIGTGGIALVFFGQAVFRVLRPSLPTPSGWTPSVEAMPVAGFVCGVAYLAAACGAIVLGYRLRRRVAREGGEAPVSVARQEGVLFIAGAAGFSAIVAVTVGVVGAGWP